jgi:hypothetical protein
MKLLLSRNLIQNRHAFLLFLLFLLLARGAGRRPIRNRGFRVGKKPIRFASKT